MDYWAETMQDDCYLIAADGWKAESYRITETDKKGKEKDKGWACDLVPKHLIVARFFAKEQEAVTKLEAELESVTARLAELEEEHGGEVGVFSELDKVNKASVTARLRELDGLFAADDQEARDEAAVLNRWLNLSNEEAALKKKLKEAEADLDARAYAKYPKLTEAEVQALAVDDKWLAALDSMIHGEMDRISQALTQRVKELVERYETPMPQITSRVAELEAKGSDPKKRRQNVLNLAKIARDIHEEQHGPRSHLEGASDGSAPGFGRVNPGTKQENGEAATSRRSPGTVTGQGRRPNGTFADRARA